MSYTTVKAVYPGDRVEDVCELHNSWGSAMPIWTAFGTKYVHNEHAWSRPTQEFWDLWKRPDIPVEHRLVFMLTFDRAYIAKKDYKRAAESIRKFLRDCPTEPGVVNHWPAIAELFESDPAYPGLGLHCTSVSEDPFNGPWNEEKGEYDPPDWSAVYSVCDELDGLGSKDLSE